MTSIPWGVYGRRPGNYVAAPYRSSKAGDELRVAIAFSREHANAFAAAMNEDLVGIGALSANGTGQWRGRSGGR